VDSESRIDRFENKLDEQGKSIAEIRERVFNGFGMTIEEISREVKELRRLAEKVDRLDTTLVDHRLDTCPLKDYLSKRIEKRVYVTVAIATVVISGATLLANIFV
jgi:uncharacterized coiled-coil protein SlyX